MQAPAHGGHHVLHRIDGAGSLADATHVRLDWKAVIFPDGTLHWELRWPLHEIAKHTWAEGAFRVAEFMRKYKADHSALLVLLGWDYHTEIFPSLASCRNIGCHQ